MGSIIKWISLVSSLALIGILTLALYTNYDYNKLNLESEYINGYSIDAVVSEYKKYSPLIDKKLAKVLWFGYLAVKSGDLSIFKSVVLSNGKKITNKNITNVIKKFQVLHRENTHHRNYIRTLNQFNECMLTFEIDELKGEKILTVSNKELRFIGDNKSAIENIGKRFTRFLNDESAEHIKERNIFVLRSLNLTVSSIELNLARFVQFILIE
jgi:hypothetical protein